MAMKLIFLNFCCLLVLTLAFTDQSKGCWQEPSEVSPFSLPGLKINSKVSVNEKPDHKLTVLCFLGTECPLAKLYAGRLQNYANRYPEVRFIGINSNVQDSLDDIRNYVDKTGIEFEMARDNRNVIADRLSVKRTPETIVCDRQRKIIYRGRIDDQYLPGVSRNKANRDDLRLAIDQALAGKPIEVPRTEPAGCLLGRVRTVSKDATVTFSNQVIRVLQKNCIECHRSDEIAPFSMETYDETVGWADMILEVIEEKRMPPWHADPDVGTFLNSRTISKQDIETLETWVDQGTPEGDKANLPEPYQAVAGWRLPREPDIVVEMRKRPFHVPVSGTIEYQYFVADPGFTEDRWVTAAEVIPGNRSVVHHSIVFVRPPDGIRPRGVGWLAAYVPGQTPLTWQPGRGRLIPKGSKLVFQQHYTPTGTAAEDVTKIGLVFADSSKIESELMTVMALDQSFEIQPHDPSHEVQVTTRRLPKQGKLLAVAPHMHYRGKSFEAFTVAADNSTKPLVRVPNYDFNWQHRYEFAQPLALSDFHRLRGNVEFDNSKANPFNPDPTQHVSWGDQTWEEMAIAFFDIEVPREDSDTVADSQALRESTAFVRGMNRTVERQEKRRQKMVEDVMKRMDKNGDGVITKDEVPRAVGTYGFRRFDTNGDHKVTRDEIQSQVERRIRNPQQQRDTNRR